MVPFHICTISAFSSRKYPRSASVSLVEQKLSDEMRQWRFTNHLLPHCCHHPWKEPVNAIHCGGSVIHSRLPIATISHHNCWDIYNFKIHVSQITCLSAFLSSYPSSKLQIREDSMSGGGYLYFKLTFHRSKRILMLVDTRTAPWDFKQALGAQ